MGKEDIAAENFHDIKRAIATFHRPRNQITLFGGTQNCLSSSEVDPGLQRADFISHKENGSDARPSRFFLCLCETSTTTMFVREREERPRGCRRTAGVCNDPLELDPFCRQRDE